MTRSRLALAASCVLAAAGSFAQPVAPSAFAWRAPLELPAGTSVARASLPPDAMLRLQSRDARDLRVFNAAGEGVPFAFLPVPAAQAAPPAVTRGYPALPLKTPAPAAGQSQGTVQVRIEDDGRQRSVLVQLDGGAQSGDRTPNAALFATRDEKQVLKALKVQATLPPNTPVQVRVSSSPDLAQWTQLPVRGRLYRFEGDGAPANDTLEFDSPVRLQNRYLRLDADAQAGVAIEAVTGVVAPAVPTPPKLRAALAPAKPADKGALEIETGFLTPLAAIGLTTGRPNTLLPVRILGRNDAAQPWLPLAHTVVYRLGSGAGEATNPPVALNRASARWLRIESSSGVDLAAQQIQAQAEFDPIQIVFVASGTAPFELALGGAGIRPAAVAPDAIASALGERKPQELPEARVGTAQRTEPRAPTILGIAVPSAPGKPALLWAVLIAGVLVLGGVAWSLLRQLKGAEPRP
jgi:hypothetical protein